MISQLHFIEFTKYLCFYFGYEYFSEFKLVRPYLPIQGIRIQDVYGNEVGFVRLGFVS